MSRKNILLLLGLALFLLFGLMLAGADHIVVNEHEFDLDKPYLPDLGLGSKIPANR